MTKKLLFATTILLAIGLALWAADASGKWTWEQQGRGGNTMNVSLTLKQDGGKLTGNVSMPGRGGDMMEQAISDGAVDGNNVSFKVVREFNDMKFETTYKGTIDGDTMKLDITRPGRGGGDPQTTSVTAKRAK